MISRPIVNVAILLKSHFVLPESYVEQYAHDTDFQELYSNLSQGHQVKELNYHVHDNMLYHLGKLCVPKGERVNVTREAHTSLIAGHFSVSKTMENIQRYFYWLRMLESVSRFIRSFSLCAFNKPSNRKLGLYTPLPVPPCPWESVSIDFVGGLPLSRNGHDYLYVVVDRFSKMCILMPCKKKNYY